MDTVSIKREDFSKFLSTLKLFQDICTDCDIMDGRMRQRSNDKLALIDVDLTGVIGETSIALSMLKTKLISLKSFELDQTIPDGSAGNDGGVVLEIDEKDLRFIDSFSTLTFRIPSKKFLDNIFIADDEFEKTMNLKEEDLILSTEVSSYLCKRIKSISEGFENDAVIWRMNGFEATLDTETTNKENTSKLLKNIQLNTEMPNCTSKMVVLPFALDINSDIKIDSYKHKNNTMMCRFKMKFFGIPVTIYSWSELKEKKE
jgi:hypothetical protein